MSLSTNHTTQFSERAKLNSSPITMMRGDTPASGESKAIVWVFSARAATLTTSTGSLTYQGTGTVPVDEYVTFKGSAIAGLSRPSSAPPSITIIGVILETGTGLVYTKGVTYTDGSLIAEVEITGVVKVAYDASFTKFELTGWYSAATIVATVSPPTANTPILFSAGAQSSVITTQDVLATLSLGSPAAPSGAGVTNRAILLHRGSPASAGENKADIRVLADATVVVTTNKGSLTKNIATVEDVEDMVVFDHSYSAYLNHDVSGSVTPTAQGQIVYTPAGGVEKVYTGGYTYDSDLGVLGTSEAITGTVKVVYKAVAQVYTLSNWIDATTISAVKPPTAPANVGAGTVAVADRQAVGTVWWNADGTIDYGASSLGKGVQSAPATGGSHTVAGSSGTLELGAPIPMPPLAQGAASNPVRIDTTISPTLVVVTLGVSAVSHIEAELLVYSTVAPVVLLSGTGTEVSRTQVTRDFLDVIPFGGEGSPKSLSAKPKTTPTFTVYPPTVDPFGNTVSSPTVVPPNGTVKKITLVGNAGAYSVPNDSITLGDMEIALTDTRGMAPLYGIVEAAYSTTAWTIAVQWDRDPVDGWRPLTVFVTSTDRGVRATGMITLALPS